MIKMEEKKLEQKVNETKELFWNAYGRFSENTTRLKEDKNVHIGFKNYIDLKLYNSGYNDAYFFGRLLDYAVIEDKIAYVFAHTSTGLDSIDNDSIEIAVFGETETFELEVKNATQTNIESLIEKEKTYEIKICMKKDYYTGEQSYKTITLQKRKR
jgi:hypothetical protein